MPRKTAKQSRRSNPVSRLIPIARRWALWAVVTAATCIALASLAHRFVPPGPTYYMKQEVRRLGAIRYQWTPMDQIAPVMARSAVAAEDANFCEHWGFDMKAIRQVLEKGAGRGASTISQQTVKNVYLWQGRSWLRKALEAVMTPVSEMIWTKRRIVEIYLNVAEFDEGVFGVDAAARHYFGVAPAGLSPLQAARLAAVLPDPKDRSASKPSAWLRKRTASIMDGAATIRRDGRAACFED
ncbi:monofunctional biosynthetic peptidoglycan transglycosylase [Roseovarius sp. M141]|uniref:monofunctional biosynthetic peptidoglycan transglycosylase n=1 Tax=Roseovarius sp. M141 TaxID=2583806 RepID=UPI0020CD8C74|nr:monofunctional biosynthetic peptidoglycan transglycosylase [Roseovarius sp. M141]MCQ0091437.1 monofunctional biosynthetic peptidoglycan transglycosylase [Roseovarius sp. M141]